MGGLKMNINWKKLYEDPLDSLQYKELKHKKDHIYDMMIGELNRISVSDEIPEKAYLLSILKENIDRYYIVCVECTEFLRKYMESE